MGLRPFLFCMEDNINHPKHYKLGNIETIDVTKNFDFILGNILKYTMRAGKKVPKGMTKESAMLEDLKKAKWYLDYKINELTNLMDDIDDTGI